MPVALTTTYYKIKELKKPIRLLQGGQGAGKNVAMAIILSESQEARRIAILTNTYDNLKDGAISDFEFIFREWGLNFNDYYNKQDKVCYWGNSKIHFRYVDNNKPDKGKGPRWDILYINEGNRVGWEAVKHYIARSKEVYVDFNPDFEFWAHTELEPREDCEKIIVTYLDNEMCPENEVRYIESKRNDVEWFKVYGKGETGTYSERRVYKFELVEFSSIPATAKRLPNGMDFGQSPDPTCEVALYLDGADLYLDEIFCENNLMAEKINGAQRDSIVDFMDRILMKEVKTNFPMEYFTKPDEYYYGYDKTAVVNDTPHDKLIKAEIHRLKHHKRFGDSSGKTELLDLRKHKYNALGVKKGTGSVILGMKRLQGYNLKVTTRSPNIQSGMESWMRKIDHNGKIIPEPDGHEPDCLAAARYVMLAKDFW